MDFLTDATLLARIQFYIVAAYHFFFVPMSVGLALIVAIHETRYYKSRNDKDRAASKFWLKIFTATFAVGVATGITMEFSFGTNWADYARFVGDIFGAPLAAEALLAFFLESVFLGVLIFGRTKVSPKMYMISSWLVLFGSSLSALWILIANSWMQTPSGAVLSEDGSHAVITDFFAAAFNPSTLPRFLHTIDALILMGAFVAIAVGVWHIMRKTDVEFGLSSVKIGTKIGIVASVFMLVFAHSSAVVVYEEQPTKFAMMEGMYSSEVPPWYLAAWVDQQSQEVIAPFAIEGGTSMLATGTWDTESLGLNELAQTEKYSEMVVEEMPVNLVFQSYHIMVAMFGFIVLVLIVAFMFAGKKEKIRNNVWAQRLLLISPVFPFIAIQSGWLTTEMGRYPWVVYPSTTSPDGVNLLIDNGVSASVTNVEIIITLVLFIAVYAFIAFAWVRIVSRVIKAGPVAEDDKFDGTHNDDGLNGDNETDPVTFAIKGGK